MNWRRRRDHRDRETQAEGHGNGRAQRQQRREMVRKRNGSGRPNPFIQWWEVGGGTGCRRGRSSTTTQSNPSGSLRGNCGSRTGSLAHSWDRSWSMASDWSRPFGAVAATRTTCCPTSVCRTNCSEWMVGEEGRGDIHPIKGNDSGIHTKRDSNSSVN